MTKAAAKKKTETGDLYDGNASQRIPFEVTEGTQTFPTAHHLKAFKDAIYLEFIDAINARIDGDTEEELIKSANDLQTKIVDEQRGLWRDLVTDVENITVTDGDDFRDLIDHSEIKAVMDAFMAVQVRDARPADGPRDLSAKGNVTVETLAFMDGKLLVQKHVLRRRTDELQKKWDFIHRGADDADGAAMKPAERAKAKGDLYRSVRVSTEGFKGEPPLRFMVAVMDTYFNVRIDPKK